MNDSPARMPTRTDLFLTYGKIGLIGFGGINAWARRVLVEEKRWLTEQEYAETLGLGQVLPGPNALNAAIMVGDRFHGAVGALLASCSMFGGPLIILMGLAVLYDSYGEVPLVKAVLAGVAAAAAGMVLGTAVKMAQKLKPTLGLLAVGLCALAAAGFFRVPLPMVVLGLAPFGILASWYGARSK
jgi:chromate transporter